MTKRTWRVRLGAAAEADFSDVLRWTMHAFGARQALIYRDTLIRAMGELARNPEPTGWKARDDILPGLRTLHVARRGRRGRHLILYRVTDHVIEIGRILHDSMDLPRHLSPLKDESESGA